MRALCIDASLAATGIVVYEWTDSRKLGTILHDDTVGHSIPKGGDVKDHVLRILKTCQVLVALAREYNPDFIVMEGPSHASKFSRHFELGGLNYNIYVQLHLTLGKTPIVMPPTRARKLGLGRGSPPPGFPGKKGQARTKRWVREKLEAFMDKGDVPSNEHKRDALVLGLAQQGFRE